MKLRISILTVILPVMFSFFIMGFVDIVGVVINYLSDEYPDLSESLVSMLASSCFLWFLFISIPAGLMVNRIGRRKSVLVSLLVTAVAFAIVTIHYSVPTVFISFSLAGIGCTILEVSLFPLCTDIVAKEKITATTAIGQLVRTSSCLLGPVLVNWLAIGSPVSWKGIFPIYSAMAMIGFIWLGFTSITEQTPEHTLKTSFKTSFQLFSDRYILAFFIGMLVLIGIDVGINITFPKYLRQSCGMSLDKAALGNSVYFLSRIIGGISGSILLLKISEKQFFKFSIVTVLSGLIGIMLTHNPIYACLFVFVLGLGYSNIFAIIFSSGMKRNLSRSNDISSLMVMGISGGAILPPLMSAIAQATGLQWTSILIMAVVWLYMFTLVRKIQ